MVALFDMVIHTIAGVFIYVLKAVFSLLAWFLKTFFKAIRMLFVALPVTSIAFVALIAYSIFLIVSPAFPQPQMSSFLFSELFKWWLETVYIYHGSAAYILLIILTILMFVPVMTVFLCIVVIASYGNVLFLSVVADAVIYLVCAVLGKSFSSQAFGRYYLLFPESGRKHAEKNYDRMLRKKNRELENELKHPKRKSDFYEDEDYDPVFDEQYGEDDEYYEDGYDIDSDYDERYDNDYEDDDYDEDSEDDEYYEEYDEDYEDEAYEDEDEDYDRIEDNKGADPMSAFDFFAGCKSRESVDKKYKSLVKLYHPDNMDGDTKALQEINVQYDKAKKRFS